MPSDPKPMTTVRFGRCRPGIKKVSLTKLIREAAGVPLKEAHELVSRLLEGEQPEIRIASRQNAERLVQQASALGAEAECVSTSPSESHVS
jgi:ribosomal protein L7/L12